MTSVKEYDTLSGANEMQVVARMTKLSYKFFNPEHSPLTDSKHEKADERWELRIGRKKLNLPKNDMLYGKEYRYGVVARYFDEHEETTAWMWDADWIIPPTSLDEIIEWNNKLQVGIKKEVLELDELPSFYKESQTQ